jgi:threonine synthase
MSATRRAGDADPWHSALAGLTCPACGNEFDADRLHNLCSCGSPLLADYDIERAAKSFTPAAVRSRAPDLWRYRELLPVRDPERVAHLGEGMTPLLPMPDYGTQVGVPDLLVKDESLLPTGSFKARGAAAGVSRAAELGVRKIALPTNGNAGSAWAAYAARAGMDALVVMPADAPEVTRRECAAVGARLYLVDGLIADAGALAAQAKDRGWFVVSTLTEPYRVEGKKTMGLEIAEQLGWRAPDVIVYPTGGGVGLIGIHKAFGELARLGLVDKTPRLVVVQATGCAPIVKAYDAGADTAEPWPAEAASTIAFGINVAKPLGAPLVLSAVRASNGTAVQVTDDQILDQLATAAQADGMFFCPEGAATLAAIRQLRQSGWLSGSEQVVVMNTGAAVKYPEAFTADPPVLPAGSVLPDLD